MPVLFISLCFDYVMDSKKCFPLVNEIWRDDLIKSLRGSQHNGFSEPGDVAHLKVFQSKHPLTSIPHVKQKRIKHKVHTQLQKKSLVVYHRQL